MQNEKLNPKEWEVLTPSGFKTFSKNRITDSDKLLLVEFSNGKSIKVTIGHRILSKNNSWINAESLKPNDKILSKDGILSICKISVIPGEKVYDLVNVEDVSCYYTNDIISHNCDELGFVPNTLAEEFLASVFPVISSGKDTKIFITSTPKGLNTFYKIWTEAEQGKNGFVPIRVHWSENPDRDEKWADEQRKNLGSVKFAQEVLCVGPNTSIVIKSKKTGKIEKIEIEEFYNRINKSITTTM